MVIRRSLDETAMDMELTDIINEFLYARRTDGSIGLCSSPRKPSLSSSASRKKRYRGMWRFAAKSIIRKRCNSYSNSEEILCSPSSLGKKSKKMKEMDFFGNCSNGSSRIYKSSAAENQGDFIRNDCDNLIAKPRNLDGSLAKNHNDLLPKYGHCLIAKNHDASITKDCERSRSDSDSFCIEISPEKASFPLQNLMPSLSASIKSVGVYESRNTSSSYMESEDVFQNRNTDSSADAQSGNPSMVSVDVMQSRDATSSLIEAVDVIQSRNTNYLMVLEDVSQNIREPASSSMVSEHVNQSIRIPTSSSFSLAVATGVDQNRDHYCKPQGPETLNLPRPLLKHSGRKPPRPPRLILSRSGSYRTRGKTTTRRARTPQPSNLKPPKPPKSASSASSGATTICALLITFVFIAIIFVQGNSSSTTLSRWSYISQVILSDSSS